MLACTGITQGRDCERAAQVVQRIAMNKLGQARRELGISIKTSGSGVVGCWGMTTTSMQYKANATVVVIDCAPRSREMRSGRRTVDSPVVRARQCVSFSPCLHYGRGAYSMMR